MEEPMLSWFSGLGEITEMAREKGYQVVEEEPVIEVLEEVLGNAEGMYPLRG